jgi:superfamily II DNA or RNA helicase
VYEGKRFVIGMVQSVVIPDKYDYKFFSYFGLVIFDEVHRMAADYFLTASALFPAKLRLGLSATTKRADGKWELVEAHIGPILVRGTQVPMKAKILVRKTGWRKPGWMKATPGKMMAVSKLQAQDFGRNWHIVEFTQAAFAAGRTTVIMSDLIDDHLKPLFHVLAKAGIPGEEMDYYIGGRTKNALDAAAKKKVVLATYAMTAEGTNKPWWDTLVLGTPRANVTQAVGRIIRKMDGKKQPVALDLVDADPIFDNFYRSREKQYYSIGAEIVHVG